MNLHVVRNAVHYLLCVVSDGDIPLKNKIRTELKKQGEKDSSVNKTVQVNNPGIEPEKKEKGSKTILFPVAPEQLIYEFEITERFILWIIRKHPGVLNREKIEDLQKNTEGIGDEPGLIHSQVIATLKSLRIKGFITEINDECCCELTFKGQLYRLVLDPLFPLIAVLFTTSVAIAIALLTLLFSK